MSQLLHIYNALLFDGVNEELVENATVVIENEVIKEVTQGSVKVDNANTVDARGQFLMPGLIDAHVHAYAADINLRKNDNLPTTLIAHHAAQRLRRMLARGFTTVRDCGGADVGLAMALESGLIPGPRLVYCGKLISQTGGHGDFRSADECTQREDDCWTCGCSYSGHITMTADGVDEVRLAVRNNLRHGASFIKFAASGGVSSTTSPLTAIQFSDEEVLAIVDEVNRFGTYCTAHIHPDAAIKRAIELGVHCIEHGTMISQETAQLAADKGTIIVPTLAIAEALLREGPALGYPEVSMTKLAEVRNVMMSGLEAMKRSGVKVGFGTDVLGSLENYQCAEFNLRSEVFTPIEILKQATSINAEILGFADELGVVKPGARADLLLLERNPVKDISVLSRNGEHIVGLVKSGRYQSNAR